MRRSRRFTFPPGFFDIECPGCHKSIPPKDVMRFDGVRVRCPHCATDFFPGGEKKQAQFIHVPGVNR